MLIFVKTGLFHRFRCFYTVFLTSKHRPNFCYWCFVSWFMNNNFYILAIFRAWFRLAKNRRACAFARMEAKRVCIRVHGCARMTNKEKPLINLTLVTCTSQIYNIHLPHKESTEINDVTNVVGNINENEGCMQRRLLVVVILDRFMHCYTVMVHDKTRLSSLLTVLVG